MLVLRFKNDTGLPYVSKYRLSEHLNHSLCGRHACAGVDSRLGRQLEHLDAVRRDARRASVHPSHVRTVSLSLSVRAAVGRADGWNHGRRPEADA